jgi:hypothetical protein
VYERDSVIYMRALSPAGEWSREWMISETLDSGDAGGQRWADNYNPSVAVSRDSANPHLMIVWERRANIEYLPSIGHSVEGCYMRGLPTMTALPTDTFHVPLRHEIPL